MIDYSNIVYEYLHKNKGLPYVYSFTHNGKIYIGLNTVFSPLVFEDSFWFAENIPFIQNGSFLEIGCGTGFVSIVAAQKGCSKILATDLSPSAIKNTSLNIILYDLEQIIQTNESNVFDNIEINFTNKFSIIFWNTPFIYTNYKELDYLEKSVFDCDYNGIESYIANARYYLEPNGRCFMGFSSSSGNILFIVAICKKYECNLVLYGQHTFDDGFNIELFEIVYYSN